MELTELKGKQINNGIIWENLHQLRTLMMMV